MKRCTIILPDTGPINSLWVADRLDLLLELDMRIVVVDAVYDELTSDFSYLKDAEVKDFIDGNSPPFVIERTDIGEAERQKRRLGQKLKKNAGELAMVDFISDEGGLERYLRASDPVAILFEDAGLRVFNRPPNLHLISTVGLLRGLEDVGVIASADQVIDEMLHPTKPGRRPEDARKFTDLPDGVDEPAAIGSTWKP
ncbi:putative nucleic acid-binding protein [Rhizobium sp. PP-F2F-G38]|nr:putative nucleic acid-binding protein [Rhizobium sp. PP-F2F-G38]